jgi:putative exporter of polyketide antibiotics
MYLIGIPLLLLPFAIYNIVAFLMPGVGWTAPVFSVHLPSGADWTMSAGDMLIAFAILMLFGEVVKATRIVMRSVVDHGLSLILFLGMLVEFGLVPQTGTATFFVLLVLSFVDVLGGFVVTLRSAQRDLSIEGNSLPHVPTS